MWIFYTDLTKERNSEELPQLLNISSCGLHIVHGGLQKGVNESGWKLGHLMRSLWQLFHDTPARHEDFVKLTGSTVFPLKLCPHRWVKDVVVAARVHQMWPNIKKYVSSFRATPKQAPQTASYATIKEACEDPLTPKWSSSSPWRNNFSHFCSSSRQMPQWLPSWGSH